MEKVGHSQATQHLRKAKKKQGKNEVDRLKQAEKKRRRLEKALATSAAIRSELEKKKQKKKEEQERLDEEGAAIAEAVALHVLLEEDADESCQIMLNNNNKRLNSLDHSSNTGPFMGYPSIANNSAEGLGSLSASYGPWCPWSYLGSGRSPYPGMRARDLQLPYYKLAGQGADISAGLLAAQAVSSLQIGENSQWDPIASRQAATLVIDSMLGGNALRDKANFCYDF